MWDSFNANACVECCVNEGPKARCNTQRDRVVHLVKLLLTSHKAALSGHDDLLSSPDPAGPRSDLEEEILYLEM